jgi:hypothetical protein
MEEIDQSLQSIVPPSQWESKSISLAGSLGGSIGLSTPNTDVFDAAVRNMMEQRDVEAVLGDQDALKDSRIVLRDELGLLKELDEKIHKLQAIHDVEDQGGERVSLSRGILDQLIYESLQCEEELSMSER